MVSDNEFYFAVHLQKVSEKYSFLVLSYSSLVPTPILRYAHATQRTDEVRKIGPGIHSRNNSVHARQITQNLGNS